MRENIVILGSHEEPDDTMVSMEVSQLRDGDKILGSALLSGQRITGKFRVDYIDICFASGNTVECFKRSYIVHAIYRDWNADVWGDFVDNNGNDKSFITTNIDNLFLLEEIHYDSHR